MFLNREQTGQLLSDRLKVYQRRQDVLVLAIPRGGVVVAHEIAKSLGLRLDIVVVRKIGAPSNPELAIGAVGPKRVVYWDENLCRRLGISEKVKTQLRQATERERKEREFRLRVKKDYKKIKGKTVILADDGIATGATVIAAQKFLKKMEAETIVLAVPVISKSTLSDISKYFDDVIALWVEEEFYAVGQFYKEFPQVSDEEVIKILASSN